MTDITEGRGGEARSLVAYLARVDADLPLAPIAALLRVDNSHVSYLARRLAERIESDRRLRSRVETVRTALNRSR